MDRCYCGSEGKYCCGKCKEKRYCSTVCQKEDWKQHKMYCNNKSKIKVG